MIKELLELQIAPIFQKFTLEKIEGKTHIKFDGSRSSNYSNKVN